MTSFPQMIPYSQNSALTLETLRLTHERWDFEQLTESPQFDWSWVITFPDKRWDWELMHLNPSFLWEWIEEFPDKPWNWFVLIPPIELLVKFPDKPWNWQTISLHQTIENVNAYPNLPWDWANLTIYSDISIEDIIAHDHHPWDIDNLSFESIRELEISYIKHFSNRFNQISWDDFSTCVPFSLFKKYNDIQWNTNCIQFHELVYENDFVDVILECGFTHWNWKFLSRWVDVDCIVKYNMFPWQELEIIHNPTLRYEHLRRFHVLGNHSRAPCESMEYVVRRWHSACVIQRAWRTCTTNPEYTMCQHQIRTFLNELESKVKRIEDPFEPDI